MLNIFKVFRELVKPRRPGIVIDTNLFIAAYWNRDSASAQILIAVYEGKIPFSYSQAIKKEVFYILSKIRPSKKYIDFVTAVFDKGRLIKPQKHVSIIKDDPQDDKYFDCAIYGKAKYIISNDKHILNVTAYPTIQKIRPAEFMKINKNNA